MKATIWILARFESRPVGDWAAPPFAETLASALRARGAGPVLLDPLDVALAPDGKRLRLLHEKTPPPDPDAVTVLLDPFRPRDDLLCLAALPGPSRLINTREALAHFRDPLLPLARLAALGLPALPAVRARRPHGIDAAIDTLGLPLELRLPLPGGGAETCRLEDRGSVRAVMDLVWREDESALLAPAATAGEIEAWIPVVGSRAFGEAPALAAEATKALGLEAGAVRVRKAGDRALVAEVVPFPAPPGSAPPDAVLQALADLALEAGSRVSG